MGKIGAIAFTRRMRQCLKMMTEGYTQKEIGLKLGISRRTVIAHIGRARMLTGAKSQAQLAAICIRHGIIDGVEIEERREVGRRDGLLLVDRETIWQETGRDEDEGT